MEDLKNRILKSLQENYSDYGEHMDEPIRIIKEDFDGKTISEIDFDIVCSVLDDEELRNELEKLKKERKNEDPFF